MDEKTASIKINIHKLGENQKIKVNNLKQENENLSKIGEKVTVANFKKNFEISSDLEIIVNNSKNETLKETDFVGTGAKVQIREKTSKKILQEYECIIYGDVDLDGEITSVDLLKIQRFILELEKFNKLSLKAGNTYKDGEKPSSADLLRIQRHILGISALEQ